MELFQESTQLTTKINYYKNQGKKIGFVPTMGYLHQGHLSLVEKAKSENDIVVVSIFVNPTQFGPKEDFQKYPRDLEHDKNLLTSVHTDIIFHPEVYDIYPDGNKVIKADPTLTNIACGTSRPGHFDGVVTVVARLFNIVQPDRVYFGLKDYQQFLVIKKMTEERKYPIIIIGCPIVREKDGLAMSSRNSYLSSTERKEALVLYNSLLLAKELIAAGEKNSTIIKEKIKNNINCVKSAKIDYIEILDRNNLQKTQQIFPGENIILLAVYIGKTRLIDNLFI